jgi:hypothetical protein
LGKLGFDRRRVVVRDRAEQQGTQARRDASAKDSDANRGDQGTTGGGNRPGTGEPTDREWYGDRRGLTFGSRLGRYERGQPYGGVVLDHLRGSIERIDQA